MSQHNSKRHCLNCGIDNDADAIYCGGCGYEFTQSIIDSTTNIKSAPVTPLDNLIGTTIPTLYPHLTTPKKRNIIRVVFFTVLIILILGAFMLGRIGQGGSTTASKNTGTTSAAGTVTGSRNTPIPDNNTSTAVIPSPTILPPTSTPTPTPIPCTTGENGNWAGWSINGDWTELNGMLLESGQDTSLIEPPDSCQPKTANVVVEATISMLTSINGGGFSINLRENSSVDGQQGYHVYIEWSIVQIGVINGPYLTFNGIAPPTDFIKYRFEVIGNQLTFFMNGIQIATVTDNRFLSSGNVSLEDNNAQLQMKSFKVIPL